MLKAGRSLEIADASRPRDAVFDAALTRAGTVRVQTYAQLFAAARILAMGRIPRGDRLAIVSNGRGPALLAADERSCEHGVTLAKLAPETVAALDAILPAQQRARQSDRRARQRIAGAARRRGGRDHLRIRSVDAVIALHVAASRDRRDRFGARGRGRRAQIDEARASARGSARSIDREVDAALEAGDDGQLLHAGERGRGILVPRRLSAQPGVAARSAAAAASCRKRPTWPARTDSRARRTALRRRRLLCSRRRYALLAAFRY